MVISEPTSLGDRSRKKFDDREIDIQRCKINTVLSLSCYFSHLAEKEFVNHMKSYNTPVSLLQAAKKIILNDIKNACSEYNLTKFENDFTSATATLKQLRNLCMMNSPDFNEDQFFIIPSPFDTNLLIDSSKVERKIDEAYELAEQLKSQLKSIADIANELKTEKPTKSVTFAEKVKSKPRQPGLAKVGTAGPLISTTGTEISSCETFRTEAVRVSFSSEITIEDIKTYMKSKDIFKDKRFEFDEMKSSNKGLTRNYRISVHDWPCSRQLSSPDFWPTGMTIYRWKGDIKPFATRKKLIKFVGNLGAGTTVTGLANEIGRIYVNKDSNVAIDVDVKEFNGKKKRNDIKNFVVEVKLRNTDKNIELLDHFDEFPKAVFTRDWIGPFPRENEDARTTLTEFC